MFEKMMKKLSLLEFKLKDLSQENGSLKRAMRLEKRKVELLEEKLLRQKMQLEQCSDLRN